MGTEWPGGVRRRCRLPSALHCPKYFHKTLRMSCVQEESLPHDILISLWCRNVALETPASVTTPFTHRRTIPVTVPPLSPCLSLPLPPGDQRVARAQLPGAPAHRTAVRRGGGQALRNVTNGGAGGRPADAPGRAGTATPGPAPVQIPLSYPLRPPLDVDLDMGLPTGLAPGTLRSKHELVGTAESLPGAMSFRAHTNTDTCSHHAPLP